MTRKANGPEDRPREQDASAQWDKIDWRAQEGQVRRLRQRIFKASQEGDWPKVRNLQKLDAAEPRQHAGQRAAGDATQHRAQDRRDRRGGRARPPRPGRRWRCGCTSPSRPGSPARSGACMYPKASNRAKLRPLGIPVLLDRCHQQRVRHALEPEWEARFEPRSYGFRPGRGCHDAIAAIYNTCKGPRAKRVWAAGRGPGRGVRQNRS